MLRVGSQQAIWSFVSYTAGFALLTETILRILGAQNTDMNYQSRESQHEQHTKVCEPSSFTLSPTQRISVFELELEKV